MYNFGFITDVIIIYYLLLLFMCGKVKDNYSMYVCIVCICTYNHNVIIFFVLPLEPFEQSLMYPVHTYDTYVRTYVRFVSEDPGEELSFLHFKYYRGEQF